MGGARDDVLEHVVRTYFAGSAEQVARRRQRRQLRDDPIAFGQERGQRHVAGAGGTRRVDSRGEERGPEVEAELKELVAIFPSLWVNFFTSDALVRTTSAQYLVIAGPMMALARHGARGVELDAQGAAFAATMAVGRYCSLKSSKPARRPASSVQSPAAHTGSRPASVSAAGQSSRRSTATGIRRACGCAPSS